MYQRHANNIRFIIVFFNLRSICKCRKCQEEWDFVCGKNINAWASICIMTWQTKSGKTRVILQKWGKGGQSLYLTLKFMFITSKHAVKHIFASARQLDCLVCGNITLHALSTVPT